MLIVSGVIGTEDENDFSLHHNLLRMRHPFRVGDPSMNDVYPRRCLGLRVWQKSAFNTDILPVYSIDRGLC